MVFFERSRKSYTRKAILATITVIIFILLLIQLAYCDTSSPVTVANGVGYYGSFLACQQQMVEMAGRIWIFVEENPPTYYNFSYTSSSNGGLTWANLTTIVQGSNDQYWRGKTVYYNGTHIAYVIQMEYAAAPNWRTYFQIGTPASNGVITWSAAYTNIHNISRSDSYGIVQTTTGRWLISYFNGSDNYFWVDSMTDSGATWISAAGYPKQLSATAKPSTGFRQDQLLPMSSGKAYAIYEHQNNPLCGRLFNGVDWEVEENISTYPTYVGTNYFSGMSGTVNGNVVYASYATSSTLRLCTRAVGGSITDILLGVERAMPSITYDHDLSHAKKDYIVIVTSNSSYNQLFYYLYDIVAGTATGKLDFTGITSVLQGHRNFAMRDSYNGLVQVYWVGEVGGGTTPDICFFSKTLTTAPVVRIFDDPMANIGLIVPFLALALIIGFFRSDTIDKIWGLLIIIVIVLLVLTIFNR